jgi:enoyl-CoA hydratase/carnithine racemase
MDIQKIKQLNETFTCTRFDRVLLVSFKNQNEFLFSDIQKNETLLTLLNRAIQDSDIKIIIFHGPTEQGDSDNIFEVFESWSEIRQYSNTILKLCNTLDQFILKLVETDKIFISALDGKMEFGFFTFSLACDYRIVTDNFTVQQPKTKVGLILRDSAEYFLSRIMGALNTIEIIASDRDIPANELLDLGLVDQVVPSGQSQLISNSFKVVENLACAPFSALKKLKKYPVKELEDFLEFKNRRLLDFIST